MKKYVLLIAGLSIFFGCGGRKKHIVSRAAFHMDTLVEIKIEDDGAAGGENFIEKAFDAAFAEIERIEKKFGAHGKSGGLVSTNARESAALDEETAALLAFGLEISSASGGAFDPTLLPLSELWFGENARHPAPGEIAAALKNSGAGKIILDGKKLRKPRALKLDFGAFAKGYAADRATVALKSAGIKAGLVNAGGDIAAFGERNWLVAVKHPRQADTFLGMLPLKNKAVATSGDYERFIEENGERRHHILDPKTGESARGVMSVTVIAKSCLEADALATAIFVMGAEKGVKFAGSFDGVDCLIVDAEGKISATAGLRKNSFRY